MQVSCATGKRIQQNSRVVFVPRQCYCWCSVGTQIKQNNYYQKPFLTDALCNEVINSQRIFNRFVCNYFDTHNSLSRRAANKELAWWRCKLPFFHTYCCCFETPRFCPRPLEVCKRLVSADVPLYGDFLQKVFPCNAVLPWQKKAMIFDILSGALGAVAAAGASQF